MFLSVDGFVLPDSVWQCCCIHARQDEYELFVGYHIRVEGNNMLPVYKERKSKSGFWLCFSGVVLLIASVFSLTVTPSADEGLEWEVQEKGFWEFHSHDQRFWHKDADKYCRQLTKGGHYDWRLPTLEELKGLLQLSVRHRRSRAGVERAIYWTATPYGEEGRRFWAVSFLSEQAAPMEEHNYNSVVCVRGGTR